MPPKPPPPSSSSHHRNKGVADPNPRPEKSTKPSSGGTSSNPNPNFASQSHPRPFYPSNDLPPPPSYGFHMLERRTITLIDGSVRSYFALPPDYEKFASLQRPQFPHFQPMRPDFVVGQEFVAQNAESLKRKFREFDRDGDGYGRQRQQLLQYGGATVPGTSERRDIESRASKNLRVSDRVRQGEVDGEKLKKAFLHFVNLIFESGSRKKKYLADGRQGPVSCFACSGRSLKTFPDTHTAIMHSYHSEGAESLVDHLAFHKALCILMGWNYSLVPDNSKAYQKLSADEVEANQNDLIMWPPAVLVHNTGKGKGKEGRMEGLGNRVMDSVLRDLGFRNGKCTSLYSKEGHLGIHIVRFSGNSSGLRDALTLSEHFNRGKAGRKEWARVQSSPSYGKDDENNPKLMELDPRTGEKRRVYYGHLATACDLEKLMIEIKKKVSIVSLREYMQIYSAAV